MTLDIRPICLVGQALIDVTLPQYGRPYKMRLGGILHAARALWAMGVPYALAHASPGYLVGQVEAYAMAHGAVAVAHCASVTGSPNVVLIGEVKEVGNQGYEYLMRDEHVSHVDCLALRSLLTKTSPSDVLIVSGGIDLNTVLTACHGLSTRLHIDLTSATDDWQVIGAADRTFDSLALSTSSTITSA